MEEIEKRLAGYDKKRAQLFSATVDELCACGLVSGCFQDYDVLADVLVVLGFVERYLDEEKGISDRRETDEIEKKEEGGKGDGNGDS